MVAKAKTVSVEPLRAESAPHAASPVALLDIPLDEDLPPRQDGVDRAWIDWLTNSIPTIGPPATVRGLGILEGMHATA